MPMMAFHFDDIIKQKGDNVGKQRKDKPKVVNILELRSQRKKLYAKRHEALGRQLEAVYADDTATVAELSKSIAEMYKDIKIIEAELGIK